MRRFSRSETMLRRRPPGLSSKSFAAVLCTVFALATSGALAAGSGKDAPSEVLFLAQLIVLLLVGRLMGEALTRIGQPSVMGMLLGGILLGPSVFGVLSPGLQQMLFPTATGQAAMLAAIAQVGILLLLLLTGMEIDLKLVRKVGRAAMVISLTGVAVPFACGFGLGELLPESLLPRADQRLLAALFLGTALSISSIKIVASIVREMGFLRRNLGQIIVASAICEDSIGWVIIAITFSLAEAGSIDLVTVSRSIIGTALFLLVSFSVGRRAVFLLMRWANDHFESEFPVITTILVIMGALALITQFIGVHTVLGAFVAGVLVGQSPILSKHVNEQLRGLILAFFMPVFFASSGLSTDLTALKDERIALLTVAMVGLASIGKFAGAFIGGKLGGLTRREALALGCGMNARGSTEVIVASIGLSIGALSHDLFTVIVVMAVATTVAMPPMLRWALARVPISEDERARLEREAREAREFLPSIERLLLTADESPNGRFTAQLAGLVAGSRAMPITVLPLKANREKKPQSKNGKTIRPRGSSTSRLGSLVERTATAAPDFSQASSPVDVTVRASEKPGEQAVANEAKKGYDLLLLGIAKPRTKSGEFAVEIERIVSAFQGPVAIVDARNHHLKDPERRLATILTPVSGTEMSRRAAELAIALSRASRGPLTALHVANTGGTRLRRWRQLPAGQGRAVTAEVAEMAVRQGVKVRTSVHTNVAPDEAILAETKRTSYDLLVMGVSRRPGNNLFFGDTAAAVFLAARPSLLFLVT
jgi:Kef-type K+ transport system membrane component KefB/nucleotide-binding universal stress UspA family protein